jgi:hypothetical protein
MFGFVCGIFSSFIFGRVRSWIKVKTGVAENTDSELPGDEKQE